LVMIAFYSFSFIGKFVVQCISLQNTRGSAGFLGDDTASLLGGELSFLLVLLRDLYWGVGLLLTGIVDLWTVALYPSQKDVRSSTSPLNGAWFVVLATL
jgi:hypothetical protein